MVSTIKPRRKVKFLELRIWTAGSKCGLMRGTVYLPGMEPVAMCDGHEREKIVRALTIAGMKWLINHRRLGRVVDCGEEP